MYHRFIGVLLKLNKADSHHTVDVGVSIVTIKVVVAVEEWCNWWRSYMHSIITVHFLRHDIVRLQQTLSVTYKQSLTLSLWHRVWS